MLRTTNDRGRGAINLTGNEFDQTIVGNAASNVIEGKAGSDILTGGGGKDIFVLSNAAVTNPGVANIDRISDYGSGDIVDIGQILNVAAGTNVIAGGYLRVTTSGLIQVDMDGGGNNWVTLSSINNGGAVTVRYLSGGVATKFRCPASAEVQQMPTRPTHALTVPPPLHPPHLPPFQSHPPTPPLPAPAHAGRAGSVYGCSCFPTVLP